MKPRVAQSLEHRAWNLMVVGSSQTVGKFFSILYFVAFDDPLTGRLIPYKWNQAWHSFKAIVA